MPRSRLLFLGHPQARNSGTRLAQDPLWGNFGFPLDDIEIKCHGVGGMLVGGLFDRSVVSKIRTFSPQTVVLMIGDNDINFEYGTTAVSVVTEMIAVAKDLMTFAPSVKEIVFS